MAQNTIPHSEETAFVHTFIVVDKQERYLTMLANPKQRSKIIGLLYHHLDLIPAKSHPIANRDHHLDFVEKILQQKGAGQTCYLISPERELDRQQLPLHEALKALISEDGVAVVCCVPGHLAYYKAETRQYILENIN